MHLRDVGLLDPSHSLEHFVGDGEAKGVDGFNVAADGFRCCVSEPQPFCVAVDLEEGIDSGHQPVEAWLMDRDENAVAKSRVGSEGRPGPVDGLMPFRERHYRPSPAAIGVLALHPIHLKAGVEWYTELFIRRRDDRIDVFGREPVAQALGGEVERFDWFSKG